MRKETKKDKEARLCANAYNVPTPLNQVFDLIVYQMRKKFSKTYMLFKKNWCIQLQNRFKLSRLYKLNNNSLEKRWYLPLKRVRDKRNNKNDKNYLRRKLNVYIFWKKDEKVKTASDKN